MIRTLELGLIARGIEPTDTPGIDFARSVRAQLTRSADATVTIVIPNYNYARYLPHAVDSALTQRGVVTDVVIVDDASTDNSMEVAHKLAAADGRIRILAHRTNSGPVATFNDGPAAARGNFWFA